MRRAGLAHDLGRLGVSNSIWDKPGPLGAGEWERVRIHPYITERMLHQSEALAPLGAIALAHRERIDGSGYPRGLSGTAISRPARIVGAADAYQAMREPRPYRPRRYRLRTAAAELRSGGRGRSPRRGCSRGGPRRSGSPGIATARRAGRPHPAGDRGAEAARPRAPEQADRRATRDLPQDRGQPRRAHLHQDRLFHTGAGKPVRDAAWPPPRRGVRHRAVGLAASLHARSPSQTPAERAEHGGPKMGRTPHEANTAPAYRRASCSMTTRGGQKCRSGAGSLPRCTTVSCVAEEREGLARRSSPGAAQRRRRRRARDRRRHRREPAVLRWRRCAPSRSPSRRSR